MEQQLSPHLKNFNKRVQVMNQTNARELNLTALEARNLHNDIFELLAHIAELTKSREDSVAEGTINIQMDGGDF